MGRYPVPNELGACGSTMGFDCHRYTPVCVIGTSTLVAKKITRRPGPGPLEIVRSIAEAAGSRPSWGDCATTRPAGRAELDVCRTVPIRSPTVLKTSFAL